MNSLLDGVESGLRPGSSREDRATLATLRNRLSSKRVTEARKPYEEEIEATLQSKSSLRVAATIHLGMGAHTALEQAVSTLRIAEDFLHAHAPNHALQRTEAGGEAASDPHA